MTQNLEKKLIELKALEDQIKLLDGQKSELRGQVFDILKEENLKTFSCDIATVSQVERKTVKYNIDKEEVLKKLEDNSLVKYFQTIPEHKEFSSTFEKDVKAGVFQMEGIEITTSTNPMVKFK